MAVDGSGNLYIGQPNNNGDVGQTNNGAVNELNLAAPPSLSFANTNVGSQSSDSPETVHAKEHWQRLVDLPGPGTGENPSVSANFTLDGSTTCPEV